MRNTVPTLIVLLLLACSEQAEQGTEVSTPATKTAVVVDIEGLLGEWQDVLESDNTVFHEQWKKSVDGTLSGLGFVLSGKDTVFIEHLTLVRGDTATHYSVTTRSAEAGPAVRFTLIHDQDSLVFENAAHDFPQRITYIPARQGNWDVTVSGDDAGSVRVDRYQFIRREADHTETLP